MKREELTKAIRHWWWFQIVKTFWSPWFNWFTYFSAVGVNTALPSRVVLFEAVDWCICITQKIQHDGDCDRSRPQGPKNVHNFLFTVRPLSWACGHGTQMLLILKKNQPDYSAIFSDMTVQRNVPRFCTRSICVWNLFQPLGLGTPHVRLYCSLELHKYNTARLVDHPPLRLIVPVQYDLCQSHPGQSDPVADRGQMWVRSTQSLACPG